MIEKQPDLIDKTVWEFAFYGENKEIIELFEANEISPPEDNFESCLINSIMSHQNSTFEMIQKKFQQLQQTEEEEDLRDNSKFNQYVKYSIFSFNFKMLLKMQKNINEKHFDFMFKKACKAGFHKIVETFLLTTKINSCGKHSALHNACIIGDLYLVKILLTIPNIEVNQQSIMFVHDIAQDYDGLTALEIDIRYGHSKIVSLLLSNPKIDVNKKSRWKGNPPLSIAAKFNNIRATKLLLARKDIYVNAQNHDVYKMNNGLTLADGREAPLHIACMYNRVEIVKLLLKHPDIDVNILNWKGERPVNLTDNQEIKKLFD